MDHSSTYAVLISRFHCHNQPASAIKSVPLASQTNKHAVVVEISPQASIESKIYWVSCRICLNIAISGFTVAPLENKKVMN